MKTKSTLSVLIIFLFALIICSSKLDAVGNTTNKASINADEQKNEIRYQDIDQYLQKEVEEAHIPGMSVILVDKDEVLFSKTYGNCKSIDDLFIIGSNSKSFTAENILMILLG